MSDELLERYDNITDYVESVWNDTPYQVKIPAVTVFWIAATLGVRNFFGMMKRFSNLNELPQSLFERQITISAKVLKVHPSYNLTVSHRPWLRSAWQPTNSTTQADLMKNTFYVRLVGCRPLGFENKTMNNEKTKYIESQILGRTVGVKLLSSEPTAAGGVVRSFANAPCRASSFLILFDPLYYGCVLPHLTGAKQCT